MNNKKFDCVDLMRTIRNNHRIKYQKDPELRKKRLEKIHKKFGFVPQELLLSNS